MHDNNTGVGEIKPYDPDDNPNIFIDIFNKIFLLVQTFFLGLLYTLVEAATDLKNVITRHSETLATVSVALITIMVGMVFWKKYKGWSSHSNKEEQDANTVVEVNPPPKIVGLVGFSRGTNNSPLIERKKKAPHNDGDTSSSDDDSLSDQTVQTPTFTRKTART